MTETLNTKSRYSAITKFSILSIMIWEYTIAATTPALGAMAASFSDISPTTVKLVQTLPALTMVIVSLLVPVLEKIAKKKTLLMIFGILLLIGGFGPAIFGTNFYVILVFRALYGAARGITFPYANAFVVDLFEGKERDKMIGFANATGNIASLVFLNLGGFLATIYWQHAFWAVLLMIPFLILVWIKCPNPDPKADAKATEDKKEKGGFSGKTWFLLIMSWIAMIFIYCFITNIAIVVEFKKLGTPQLAATFLTTFTVVFIISGLIFGNVLRPLFKKYTVAVGLIAGGIGLFILFLADTIPIYFVGSAVWGFGFAVYNLAMFIDLPETVKPTLRSSSLAYFMAFSGIGHFTSPLILDALGRAFNFDPSVAGFQISGPALVVGGVICIIVKAVSKPKALPAEGDTTAQ